MAYKGSPTLLCHLVLLDTLLIGVYTLRSMGVNALFLRLNMNDILLGSSDLFFHVRYPICYEAIRQALWIGLKVVDFMMRPLKILKITRL